MVKKIRIGLVGTGVISQLHYNAIKTDKNVELIGVVETNKNRLKKVCLQWNVRPYNKIEDMLKDKDIDAFFVLIPTWMHYDQALKVLKAGRHVLIEKAVCLNINDINKLEQLAKKKNLVCMPGHNEVYNQVFIKAGQIIKKGILGKIIFAEFRNPFFLPRNAITGWRRKLKYSGGGTLMDSGTHLFYQTVYLLGMPESITAMIARRYHPIEAEDTASVIMQYKTGAIVNLLQTWVCNDNSIGAAPTYCPTIKIMGDKNTLTVSDALYLNKRKIGRVASRPETFSHMLKCFVKCVQGKEKPVSGLEQAKQCLQLVQAAYKSAATKEIILL